MNIQNNQNRNPSIIINDTHPDLAFGGKSKFTAAYDRRLRDIQRVTENDLLPVNIDIHGAVTTILGALPEILALRPELVTLPGVGHGLVDALGDYAMAAAEASLRYTTAIAPQVDITSLNDEAVRLRESLRADATALARRGLIDPAHLAAFNGHVGYKNVAFELMAWANLIQGSWSSVQGKTAIHPAELVRAKELGEQLVVAAGVREQGPTVVAETARIRQQAFTLLVRTYDQVRRALAFLRWDTEDAETIAPSLYAGRGGRGKRDTTGTEAQAQAERPSTPAPAVVVTRPNPLTSVVAPVGLPGSPPFSG